MKKKKKSSGIQIRRNPLLAQKGRVYSSQFCAFYLDVIHFAVYTRSFIADFEYGDIFTFEQPRPVRNSISDISPTVEVRKRLRVIHFRMFYFKRIPIAAAAQQIRRRRVRREITHLRRDIDEEGEVLDGEELLLNDAPYHLELGKNGF